MRTRDGHLVFLIDTEKHKLSRGLWNLTPCQVSLNSVQLFQRRSRKCLSQSEAGSAILFLPIGPKNTNLVRGVEILLPVKFQWIQFSRFRGEVANVSDNQRLGRSSCFSDWPENINLVKGVEILLPVMFYWIPFSGFREKVENILANQRLGRPSCFSDWPEKPKLGSRRCDLASCQVSLNSAQPFQRRSRKCLSQSEARPAILFFRSARKTKTW